MGLFRTFVVLALFAAAVQAAQASPPALEAYAALPLGGDRLGNPRLSPDGKSIALISSIGGRRTFTIRHLDGTPDTVIAIADAEPRWIEWKTNDRLIFGVAYGIEVRLTGPSRREYSPQITMLGAINIDNHTFKVIYLDEGDHALNRGEDRLAVFSAFDAFLAENLR